MCDSYDTTLIFWPATPLAASVAEELCHIGVEIADPHGAAGRITAHRAQDGQLLLEVSGEQLHGLTDLEAVLATLRLADVSYIAWDTEGLSPKHSWLGSIELSTELPSGVIDMGARSYVPEIGRFLQPDPIPGGSANAYSYTVGDPVNSSDPSGEFTASYVRASPKDGQQAPQNASPYKKRSAAPPKKRQPESQPKSQDKKQPGPQNQQLAPSTAKKKNGKKAANTNTLQTCRQVSRDKKKRT